MTVSAVVNKIAFPGPGGTVFAANFPIVSASDVEVYKTDQTTGKVVGSALVNVTDYTVTGVGGTGFTVTLTADLGAYGLLIRRVEALTMGTNLPDEGNLRASSIQAALDKLARVAQQLQEQLSRSLHTAISGLTADWTVPEPGGDGYVLGNVGKKFVWLSAATAQLAADLLSSAVGKGSAIISYLASYTGAVVTTLQKVLDETVSVTRFNAAGDGVTDDSAAVISAIAISRTRPVKIIFPPTANGYYLANKILVPSNVTLDFMGNTILGPGGTSIGFETATWVGSVLTSNIGTSPESTLIKNTWFKNGVLKNFQKAFNLQDMIWTSGIKNVEFVGCGWSIYADRCFFSSFTNLNTNGLLTGHTGSAYYFKGVNNLLRLTAVTVTGGNARAKGFEFISDSAADCSIVLDRCGCEQLTTSGMLFTGNVNGLRVNGCYFEAIPAGVGIDLSSATNKYGIDIDSNWFYNVQKAVVGAFCLSGRWGAANRLYTDVSVPTAPIVNFSETVGNAIVVEIPEQQNFANVTTNVGLPSNYLVGSGCVVNYRRSIYTGGGVAGTIDQKTTNPIPFSYTGTGGTPDANVIPFCAVTKPGASGNVVFDTWIPYSSPDMVGVSLSVQDDGGIWPVAGFIVAGNFVNAIAGGKTVTISNNAGYIRVTAGTFNSATSTYTVRGVIRHL